MDATETRNDSDALAEQIIALVEQWYGVRSRQSAGVPSGERPSHSNEIVARINAVLAANTASG